MLITIKHLHSSCSYYGCAFVFMAALRKEDYMLTFQTTVRQAYEAYWKNSNSKEC